MPSRGLFAVLLVFVALGLACGDPTISALPAAQIDQGTDQLPGRLIFVKDGNLWLWSEGRSRQLTSGGTWQQPDWSPDAGEIAYVYRATNFSELFVMAADGSNNRRLTRSQSQSLYENDWVFRPTWSPDGAQIAFITDNNSSNPLVWLMNRDGTGRRQVPGLGAFDGADTIAWSPDGHRLAITAFGEETSQIVLVDLARGTSQVLTRSPKGAIDPAWSPDGRILAYAVRGNGRMDIVLRPVDGDSETVVSSGGLARAPSWSPDGQHLAYISTKGGTFELYAVDIQDDGSGMSGANERQLTRDLNLDGTSGVSWAR